MKQLCRPTRFVSSSKTRSCSSNSGIANIGGIGGIGEVKGLGGRLSANKTCGSGSFIARSNGDCARNVSGISSSTSLRSSSPSSTVVSHIIAAIEKQLNFHMNANPDSILSFLKQVLNRTCVLISSHLVSFYLFGCTLTLFGNNS